MTSSTVPQIGTVWDSQDEPPAEVASLLADNGMELRQHPRTEDYPDGRWGWNGLGHYDWATMRGDNPDLVLTVHSLRD